jgi:DNA modification methylase
MPKIPLAADFAVQLRDIGFVMVNEIIWSKDRTGGTAPNIWKLPVPSQLQERTRIHSGVREAECIKNEG